MSDRDVAPGYVVVRLPAAASVAIRVTVGDREATQGLPVPAEPGQVAVTARLETDETVQHGLPVCFGNSRAAVRDFQHGALVTTEDSDLDLAGAGIFEGVIEQIGERL